MPLLTRGVLSTELRQTLAGSVRVRSGLRVLNSSSFPRVREKEDLSAPHELRLAGGLAAVCGRGPPAGAFCIPTPSPAPPRREDLVNVRVGEGEPAARLYPLEARSGFHPTGVSPRRTVDLGCGGTGAVDLTIQSNRTSAAVKSGRMA